MYKNNNHNKDKEDFIELLTLEYCLWNRDLAKKVFDIRHKLNWFWFEYYIMYALKKIYNINLTKRNLNELNDSDDWIDLEWYMNNNKIYIQCKKYIEKWLFKWKVWKKEIMAFYWWISSENNCKNINNIQKIFISTWIYTDEAKKFALKNNIELLNYKDISEICNNYSVYDFLYEYKLNNSENKIDKIKWDRYEQLSLINYSFDELNNNDILNFWKNIRKHIVEQNKINELNTWKETFTNITLEKLAKDRINSYNWLKNFYNSYINIDEKKHIKQYFKELKVWIDILWSLKKA